MKVIERVKNNKTLLILFFLILLCLILMLFRLTKSYLDSKIEDEQEVDVDVTAQQTDDLKFIEGNPLSLNVNPTTLPQNGSNLVSTTHPRVELLANDTTNTASYTYSIYVHISNNTFTYSDGSTPEILLSITNPSNTAITTINGYSYVTQNGVSGFDVTSYNGYIPVAVDYAITSSSSTTPTVQNWTFTLTYLNLNIDQSENIGKNFDIDLIFMKNNTLEIEYAGCTNPSITNTYFLNCDNSLLACRVAHDFNPNDIANSKVVLHNGIVLGYIYGNDCAVLDAEDNSYRYTGGDYKVTQKAITAGYNYVNTYINYTTAGVIGVNCNGTNRYIGYSNSSCSTKYYYLQYDTNVTQYATYQAAINQAISDGYVESRYINNYICFGYDRSVSANETTCPEQNLYRIIGAFDDDEDGNYEVKVIKYEYASAEEIGSPGFGPSSVAKSTGYRGSSSSAQTYYWSGSTTYDNDWVNSTLRTTNLNNYFINTYLKQGSNGTYWTSMIPEKTWIISRSGTGTPKNLYNSEHGANSDTVNNYVGLLLVSEYSYSMSTLGLPNNRSGWSDSIGGSYNDYRTNYMWIYGGLLEWTLTRSYDDAIYMISESGTVNSAVQSNYSGTKLRPVFYLDSGVEVLRGLGTKASPYYVGLSS